MLGFYHTCDLLAHTDRHQVVTIGVIRARAKRSTGLIKTLW